MSKHREQFPTCVSSQWKNHFFLDLEIVGFSGNSSRVVGHGVFSRVCRCIQEG